MKQHKIAYRFRTFFIIALALAMIVPLFAGCQKDGPGSDPEPASPKDGEPVAHDSGGNEVDVEYGNGETMNLNAYIGSQAPSMSISGSVNVNDRYYVYYYELGTVSNVPIYTSDAWQYTTIDYATKFSFQKFTSTTVETAFSRATQTVDTHSHTKGGSLEIEVGGKVKKIVKVGGKVAFDDHDTHNSGTIVTETETTINSYIEQYSQGYEVSVVFDAAHRCKQGYSYRLSLYKTIKLYGVVVYDVVKDEYVVSYEEVFTDNNRTFVIEESSDTDGNFHYNIQTALEFDVDAAIEMAKVNPPTRRVVEEGEGTAENPYLIFTAADFVRKLSPTAHLQLMNDIDFGGQELYPVGSKTAPFIGSLEGSGHAIYHFIIKQSAQGQDDSALAFGVLGVIGSGGTVQNLQVGKEGYETKIDPEESLQKHHSAGMIAGYANAGAVIENCRIVNCKVYSNVGCNSHFSVWNNIGGVCGTLRGTVSGCYVAGGTISAEAWASWDKNNCHTRSGGIAGYAEDCTISDCFVSGTTIYTFSWTRDGKNQPFAHNPAGMPNASSGGIAGVIYQKNQTTSITRCVVGSNTITAHIQWIDASTAGGDAYAGSLAGEVYSAMTTLANIVVGNNTVKETRQSAVTSVDQVCSSGELTGYWKTETDLYTEICGKHSGYGNLPWQSGADGKIALRFSVYD